MTSRDLGHEDIMIGDTADTENPVALPRITVDEPAISMTIGEHPDGRSRRRRQATARVVRPD